MSGYASREYAESFTEIATVRELPSCGGWLLEREIPNADARDAMGCYPLFHCPRPERLGEDLDALRDELAAVSLVTDPFAGFEPELLSQFFTDVCKPFKEHFAVDFSKDWESTIGSHHRRKARAALRELRIERAENPVELLDVWCELYRRLIARHSIRGLARFSRAIFELQLQVPGMVAFHATSGGETCGILLWYLQHDTAYYHLGAFSPTGYALGASHALFMESLAYFAWRRCRFAALGAGAGLSARPDDGLTRFKEGWANSTRSAWFCGRVLNRSLYDRCIAHCDSPRFDYFPAYRCDFGRIEEPAATTESRSVVGLIRDDAA